MARFYPDRYLAQVLPRNFEEKGLLFDNLHPRKMYLRALYRAAGKEGKALTSTVYETIRTYQKKEEALQAAGVADYADVAVNDQALLKNRVKNFLVWNKVQEEKQAHSGQFYRWLPSDAQNPDPEHQLLYGKVFRVGTGDKDGNMPGERYGCRCGIEWLDSGEAKAEKLLSKSNPEFVQKAQRMFDLAEQGLHKQARPLPFQTVTERESRKIKRATGLNVQKGKKHVLTPNAARHVFKQHGNMLKESKRKQIAVSGKEWALIPKILKNYDRLEVSKHLSGNKYPVLIYIKNVGNRVYHYVEELWKKKEPISKTFFIKKK